jgi:Permeases of the major facilitator superfamily
VLDAYALTLASLLLTSGVLADRYGLKLLFQIGLVIFTLGSLLCGVAQGPADADRVPERPGRRRGDHVRHVAGAARKQLPRPGSRGGVRGLGGGHRCVHGARPGPRRRDHHRLELARHLPGQRADRRSSPSR